MLGIVFAVVVVVFVLYYLLFVAHEALLVIHCGDTPRHVSAVLTRCPTLTKSKFYPVPWLIGGHLQTLAASALRPKPVLTFQRELVPLSDGGEVALDWMKSWGEVIAPQGVVKVVEVDEPPQSTKPVLIILHGTNGGSDEKYVRHMVVCAHRKGFLPVAFICRGENGTALRNNVTYSAGGTQDFREIVLHIKIKRPNAAMVAVGYSLGGNILTRYVGEEGSNCLLRGAAVVSNPLDLVKSSEHLAQSFLSKLYDSHLAVGLVRYARRHLSALAACPAVDVARALSTKSAIEYLSLVSCKLWGFTNPEEYCAAQSSMSSLSGARIPLLCLNALDDPIISPKAVDEAATIVRSSCPYVVLAITGCGGHLGWLEPKRIKSSVWKFSEWASALMVPVNSWADRVCCEFLSASLQV